MSRPPAILPTTEFATGWSEIEEIFARLRALAVVEQPAERFYADFLGMLVTELPAAGGVVWRRLGPGSVEAVCQLHPQVAELVEGLASQRFHLATVEEVARNGRSIVAPPRSSVLGQVNPTSVTLVLSPVKEASEQGWAEFVVELFLTSDRGAEEVAGVASILDAAANLALEFHRQARSRSMAARLASADALDAFAAAVHARLGLESTAFTIVNECARLLAADRVSLLLCEAERCRTLAVSGSVSFDRRATIVRALEELGAAVAVTGGLSYPTADELPPQVEDSLQEYIDAGHAMQLEVQPLRSAAEERDEEEERGPLGVLVVEHFREPEKNTDQALLKSLARHSAGALANALVCQRWTWFRFVSRWRGEDALRERRIGKWKWMLAGTVAAATIIGLIPAKFEIAAPGRLQPAKRRDVFAPADGVVVTLLVSEGATVKKEQPLAELASPALELQISEVLGKRHATEAAIAAARAFRLTEPGGSERADPARFAAQEEELTATLAGLQEQFDILAAQRKQLVVRSPMAGEVVTRDADRRLTARPVRSGELLLRVADVQGPWQLELELPEHRVRTIIDAREKSAKLPVRFIIAATPSHNYQATLAGLGEAAQVDDQGQPYVPALANVTELPTGAARPGASVQAKILCGRRPLAYVWLHDVWDAIATRWWH